METTRIIEHYLDGTLSIEDQKVFEERSAHDPEFRSLVALHQEVNESIRDNDLYTLKQLLEKIDKKYGMNPEKTATLTYRFWLRIAASFLFIFILGICVRFTFFNPSSNESLYEKFYTIYSVDVISRSGQNDQQLLEKAIVSYSQAQYSDAIFQLDKIVQHDQNNYQAWFYRGLACLEIKSAAEAIQSFRSIPDTWTMPYIEHRNWYLALALLKDNQNAEASEVFKSIIDQGGYYSEKAQKIYKKIKR